MYDNNFLYFQILISIPALVKSTVGIEPLLEGLRQGNGMIVIITILFILAVGASVGIYLFLRRRRMRQGNKNNHGFAKQIREDEIYNVAEQLKQVIHQIEETSEDGGESGCTTAFKGSQKLLKDIQVQVNKIKPDTEMPQLNASVRCVDTTPSTVQPLSSLKGGSKKVAHQVEGTTKSKSEIVSRRRCEERSNQKLEKSEDDDIFILSEKLTKLSDEYEETYQKLRQIIANKYKQLQDVSQHINTQAERLKKLTAQGNTDSAGAEDVAVHEVTAERSEHSESTFNEIETPEHPPKYTEVHKLAEQGIDRAEIARRTELPIGEVDLLLSLTKEG